MFIADYTRLSYDGHHTIFTVRFFNRVSVNRPFNIAVFEFAAGCCTLIHISYMMRFVYSENLYVVPAAICNTNSATLKHILQIYEIKYL